MEEGPPESAFKSRFQIASSGCLQKWRCVSVEVKVGDYPADED
jgi:hypothetical protein